MSAKIEDTENLETAKIERQHGFLPPAWRAVDRCIMRSTEIILFLIGAIFAVLITLEVVSRYIIGMSFMFVNAGSRFLLVWFFILGAGPALRYGAHIGFELLVNSLPPARRRAVLIAAQILTLVFFLEMVWAGVFSLGPAWRQNEPGLEISLGWAFLSIPVGFALLIYHLSVLMVVELRRPAGGSSPS